MVAEGRPDEAWEFFFVLVAPVVLVAVGLYFATPSADALNKTNTRLGNVEWRVHRIEARMASARTDELLAALLALGVAALVVYSVNRLRAFLNVGPPYQDGIDQTGPGGTQVRAQADAQAEKED